MAANWWVQSVYPPRYFCGHLVVRAAGSRRRERLEFIDAPLLPLDANRAALFVGTRGGCFYSGRLTARELVPEEIQYAISVLDLKRQRVRVEKFVHPFDHPEQCRLVTRGELTTLERRGGPLYRLYPLGQVFDDCAGITRRVLQFVA